MPVGRDIATVTEIDLAEQQRKDRPPVINADDAVQLPAANDGVEDRVHIVPKVPAATDRQFIDAAELEHLRDPKNRFRALTTQVVGILHG